MNRTNSIRENETLQDTYSTQKRRTPRIHNYDIGVRMLRVKTPKRNEQLDSETLEETRTRRDTCVKIIRRMTEDKLRK